MRTLFRSAIVALATATMLAACATYQDERDTTQPGKLQKAAFADGPWYTLRTVIDSPYEASFTFIGEAGAMEKIQWDIQENYLYAYRTHEFIRGSDGSDKAAQGDSFRGEPIAAYEISSHFDLWHQYNPVTGEELPVLYEAQERPWYEREYMRVDWSKNLVESFQFMGSQVCEVTGLITKDPIAYAPTKPGDPLQVYFGNRTADGNWQNHYDLTTTQSLNKIDYIDVVNREFVRLNVDALFGSLSYSDAQSCLGYPMMPLGGGMQVTYRQSFMKVDQDRFAQAEPVFFPDPAFEKFGYFRSEDYTYDAERGPTDNLNYLIHRWNIWEKTKDAEGNSIPYVEREIRPIVYYVNPETPEPFRKIAHEHISKLSWNEAFRDALRSLHHPQAESAEIFMTKDVETTCGPNGDLACQQLGDLRYSFMHYVDRPSLGSPLGYGPSFTDPETGEIVMAVANFYGAALHAMRGYVGDLVDLAEGTVTEDDIMTGENVRDYFQQLGNVIPPTFPQVNLDMQVRDELRHAQNALEIEQVMRDRMPKAIELKHDLEELKRNGTQTPYAVPLQRFAGTAIEKMLVEADYGTIVRNVGVQSFDELSRDEQETVLDEISPFRREGLSSQFSRWMSFWAERNVLRAEAIFDDASMIRLVTDAKKNLQTKGLDDVPGNGDEIADPKKSDIIDWIILHTFRGVEEHEVGHTLGLRHNFEGTFDEENYHDEYWDIVNGAPDTGLTECETLAGRPNLRDRAPSDFDLTNDNVLNFEEWQSWYDDHRATKRCREAMGIDFYTYSSIMDYSMHFYYNDVVGIGKYDHAAIKFGYANTIEVYTGPKGDKNQNRADIPYFVGGERCSLSSECPANGSVFNVAGQEYAQRCRINVSHQNGQAPLGAGVAIDTEAQKAQYGNRFGVCSNVLTELKLGEYVNWQPGDTTISILHPNHRFCSDERVNDRPFCTRYDEGKSAVEVVENTIEEYNRSYIFNNFRRYRLNFEPYNYFSRIFGRYYQPIGKIYQSMLYQLYYTPGFLSDQKAGLADFLQASIIGLNFFGQVIATPDVGAYTNWQDPSETPVLESDYRYGQLYDAGADVYVPVGIGKYLWTELEQGYYGAIRRYARMGSYWDKQLAIEALATRDWGFPQANDETYPINFYDGFKPELLAIFGGMATDNPGIYGPAMKRAGRGAERENQVQSVKYRNFWTGRFFDSDLRDWGLAFSGPATLVGFPNEQPGDGFTLVDPGGSVGLRLNSLLYAMAYFPVFYDNTFPGYVQLKTFGAADARFEAGLNDPTTLKHFSPKYNKLYAATQTSDTGSFTAGMIERASLLTDRLEHYSTTPNGQALLAHPRCGGSDVEICRQRLINYTERELESVETTLNFTAEILGMSGY